MRDFLNRLISYKEKRAAELRKLIKEASTADEVRSLGDTLQAVLDELNDAKKLLEDLPDDNGEGGDNGDGGEGRSANPVSHLNEFRMMRQYGQPNGQTTDPTDSVEYRQAFMDFVCRGVPIPMQLRDDAITTTTDTSAVIPTTMLHEIVREIKSYGEVYARLRHLNVQGGVNIPILNLMPKATWITADTGTSESDKQKLEAKTSISFSYYGLECKLAQTLLVNVTTLEIFQEQFVQLAAEAIIAAVEVAVFNGTGSGMPMGITKDTRVPTANAITLSPADFKSWEGWKKKVFAKMKKSYRKGEFFMAQGTFEGYIDGMVDTTGQPIGRVNYGIDGEEKYRFGGKNVVTVEDDVVADYDSAKTGDVVAVFVDLKNYGFNTNMQMKVVKWVDNDTNELKNKCILIADGKLIDPNGVLLVKKGAE